MGLASGITKEVGQSCFIIKDVGVMAIYVGLGGNRETT